MTAPTPIRLTCLHMLKSRDRAVLELVLAGRNDSEISDDLELSPATVEWHMHAIRTWTGASGREDIMSAELELGAALARLNSSDLRAPAAHGL